MAGEIKPPSLTGGFLTPGGQLKDKQTLAAEDRKAASASTSATTSTEKNISNALASVKSRFTEQANTALNSVNERDDALSRGQDNIKQQIEVSKDLKAAIKDGDSEAADQKRAELAKLQEERNKIAEEIQNQNKDRGTDSFRIAFGNDTKAVIRVDATRLDKADPNQELQTKQQVQDSIDSLQSDLESIKSQRAELKDDRREIRQVVKETRAEIDNIEKDSLSSLDDAQKLTDKVASAITSAGAQSVLASNVNGSVASKLLTF